MIQFDAEADDVAKYIGKTFSFQIKSNNLLNIVSTVFLCILCHHDDIYQISIAFELLGGA